MKLLRASFYKSFILITLFFISLFIFIAWYIFDDAVGQKKKDMAEEAYMLSRMISSVAVFDSKHSKEKEFGYDTYKATLSQVIDAYSSKNLNLEYLLGTIIDDQIVFIAYSKNRPPNVDVQDTSLAVPMRNALNGKNGGFVGFDYSGSKVFAGFSKVKHTPWGLVVKEPYDIFLQPYLNMLIIGFLITIFLLFSIYYFLNYINKQKLELIKKNEENLKQFEIAFDNAFDGISMIENGRFVYCNKAVLQMLRYDDKEQFFNLHPSQLSPEFQPDGKSSKRWCKYV